MSAAPPPASALIDAYRTSERRCAHCERPFLPVRRKQRYCPAPARCRMFANVERNKHRPHKCGGCASVHRRQPARVGPRARRHVRVCSPDCWCKAEPVAPAAPRNQMALELSA